MDNIIERLETLKKKVAAGMTTAKDVDEINEIIRCCEKKKEIMNACLNPLPSQEDMLPVSESDTGFVSHIVIEQATINIYGEYPPSLGDN